MNWQPILEHIQTATGSAFKTESIHAVAGGDINSAFRLQSKDTSYFVKLNQINRLDMFVAETEGLSELAAAKTLRIPSPIVFGKSTEHAFLVLEYIEFGTSGKNSARQLGQQLALLHQIPQAYFGWHRNNTIGSTPQENTRCEDWPEFWRTQRLLFQLKLAAENGYGSRLQTTGVKLCESIAGFFDGYRPQPALLHGDLWGGNRATDKAGNPVIFDPACYYGDKEADIAMTELFGGFGRDFYAAYQEISPLDPGYETRKTLYNLYHILNHLNLFGGGYLRQAEDMIASLLSEIR